MVALEVLRFSKSIYLGRPGLLASVRNPPGCRLIAKPALRVEDYQITALPDLQQRRRYGQIPGTGGTLPPRFQGGNIWDWQDKALLGITADGNEYLPMAGILVNPS